MKTVKRAVLLTLIFELITILFRYGFHLESTRDTASTIGVLTLGFRVHHGYIGLFAVLLFYSFFKKKTGLFEWVAPIGFALLFSDLIHHFLILWPIEGDPQFHLFYPKV